MLARGSLGNPWRFERLLGRSRGRAHRAARSLAELELVIARAEDHLGRRARRPLPAQVLPLVRGHARPLAPGARAARHRPDHLPRARGTLAASALACSCDSRDEIRRAAGWALVAGLSIAALTAVVALIVGDFDDTEVRVILTSLGFAIASSLAAVGAAQRLRSSGALRMLGTATAVLAAVAFALLVAGLWTGDWGSEGIWRSWGCAALLAVAGSHACVVLGARRSTDTTLVGAPWRSRSRWRGSTHSARCCRSPGLVEDVADRWRRSCRSSSRSRWSCWS